MTPESRALAERYVTGKASAKRELLFDRMGSPGHWDDKEKWRTPIEYWCPSVMIEGKQNGVIGPSGYHGHYRRKEAVAEAQAFIDKCRELLDAEKPTDGA